MESQHTPSLFDAHIPRKTFGDLSYRELVLWLHRWGHSWPGRFIQMYGREFVVGLLDELVESPVTPNPRMSPPALVNAARALFQDEVAQAGIEQVPRARRSYSSS